LFYPPNRLVEPPLDVVEPVPVPVPVPAPKSDEIPPALPALPESLTELAVTVPLLALIPADHDRVAGVDRVRADRDRLGDLRCLMAPPSPQLKTANCPKDR
jgi:hypothetical protein